MNGRVDKFVHPMKHVNGDVVPQDAMMYAECKRTKSRNRAVKIEPSQVTPMHHNINGLHKYHRTHRSCG